MATTHSDKSRAQSTSGSAAGMDAIDFLKQDHREVEAMFKAFQGTGDPDRQAELCEQICNALKVHTQIEEELFYPAAREEIGDSKLVEEAMVEHEAAKELIAQIERMEPEEELFEARMQVLCEQITHHVNEEETELFPACRKAGMDLDRIGRKLAERKQELMSRKADGGSMAH
jgi:hemerythrin superfamily protein